MRKEVVAAAALTAAAAITAIAALVRHRKRRKEQQWKETQKILRKFARDCATPVPKLWQVANAFVADMRSSLIASNGTNTSLNMLVSYVASLPSGDEEGMYYGVNLRRTDFLLLCARLRGKNDPISDFHREEIHIPTNLLDGTGSTKELFGFIAVELGKFVEAHPNSEMKDRPAKNNKLGFIISCPVDQAVATSGTAITWKSFAADSTLGKKLVHDFNRALEEHGVKLSVYAMVDDTVGTLAGGRYYNRESVAAITLGMGTDAAYVEPADAALQWHGPSPKLGEMVISTQWGEFSTPHLPITIFDTCLDAESSNPGFRRFEKVVSGMYLGEVVRRVLLKMAKETALFGQCVVPSKLMTPYQLSSPDMAAMHQDTSDNREVVGEKLKEVFGITKSTPEVREVVAEVCDIVAERGARLAGAGILGIIKKLGRIENKRSIVTVEGGLYEHYRVFRNYLNSGVWEMLGDNHSDNVVIENSHGGSGTGALYLAASQMKDIDQSQMQDSDPDVEAKPEPEPEPEF
ncbi:PREDICTED: probable hexokinase-like 2 protein [Fragaria vesca subsp. vesca]|uniref:probable hexokinase-like 2 protein n=1 Tax=Fragaria vesca subsp. vesca TaxID=101020 RepID=UPI0002C33067|nr:PREDICTED: probable hexokinase-like 2 protein [Fragaria vesca subsp. vesca]